MADRAVASAVVVEPYFNDQTGDFDYAVSLDYPTHLSLIELVAEDGRHIRHTLRDIAAMLPQWGYKTTGKWYIVNTDTYAVSIARC